MASQILSAARLRELLDYDPATGVFTWLVNVCNRALAGTVAGCKHHGYVIIMVEGKNYRANRLAWFYMHRKWPPHEVDHINHNRADNRIDNLRLATKSENGQNRRGVNHNNQSGYCGVYWDVVRQRWTATLMLNGKWMHRSRHTLLSDAIAARRAAELKYFPFKALPEEASEENM